MGQLNMAVSEQVEKIKILIQEAEKDVDIAERHLKDSQLRLTYLKNQLQECLISGVSGLKSVDQNNNVKEPAYKPPENEDEASRKARVRWRVLGMKIKFGLVTQAMAVKRRNLQDASSFIDKESEEASKEDQLDLEGKCHRKKEDKRYFRRGGVAVGSVQGRDNF